MDTRPNSPTDMVFSLALSLQVWVASIEHPRVSTCSLYASPTGLSPYLRFGCLSCRVLYYNLRELYMKVTTNQTIETVFNTICYISILLLAYLCYSKN